MEAKERGQWGEGAKLPSTSFFPAGVLIRIVIVYILSCIHRYDCGNHISRLILSRLFVPVCYYYV